MLNALIAVAVFVVLYVPATVLRGYLPRHWFPLLST